LSVMSSLFSFSFPLIPPLLFQLSSLRPNVVSLSSYSDAERFRVSTCHCSKLQLQWESVRLPFQRLWFAIAVEQWSRLILQRRENVTSAWR
jgi:hypothetical protein